MAIRSAGTSEHTQTLTLYDSFLNQEDYERQKRIERQKRMLNKKYQGSQLVTTLEPADEEEYHEYKEQVVTLLQNQKKRKKNKEGEWEWNYRNNKDLEFVPQTRGLQFGRDFEEMLDSD